MMRFKAIQNRSLSGRLIYQKQTNFKEDGWTIRHSIHHDQKNWELHLPPKEKFQPQGYLELHFDFQYYAEQSVFCNGYQTWTESKWFSPYDKIPNLRPLLKPIWKHFRMNQYGDYDNLHYQRKELHSYHFTVIKSDDTYHFIASLDEANGFAVFIHDGKNNRLILRQELGPNQSRDAPIQVVHLIGKNLNALYNSYFQLCKVEPLERSSISGWTSWYHYYTNIDASIIWKNLQAFSERQIPIDIFQIDDGWQVAIGDWQHNDKFPDGMKLIADKVKAEGFSPGLWLAPFVCDQQSFIYKEHKGWIRKNKSGQLVEAGYSLDWEGPFYVLEWRATPVRAYLKKVFTTILQHWGFDMLKLDFLYAVTLGLDQQTKGAEMYEAMEWLKQVTTGKKILACGVPLGPAFGKVAYCRISSDIALTWEDIRLSVGIRYRERVSTLNALRSTITRSFLNHKAFVNDPDVFILRKKEQALNDTQQKTLYLINQALGSLIFTSDFIGDYDSGKMRLYLQQFPLRTKDIVNMHQEGDKGWVILQNRDLIYLLVFNLTKKSQTISLPEGQWINGNGIIKKNDPLAAFETKVYLKDAKAIPQLLFSDGHIFPGMEIEKIEYPTEQIYFDLHEDVRLQNIEFIFEVSPEFMEYEINRVTLATEQWNGKQVVKYKMVVE